MDRWNAAPGATCRAAVRKRKLVELRGSTEHGGHQPERRPDGRRLQHAVRVGHRMCARPDVGLPDDRRRRGRYRFERIANPLLRADGRAAAPDHDVRSGHRVLPVPGRLHMGTCRDGRHPDRIRAGGQRAGADHRRVRCAGRAGRLHEQRRGGGEHARHARRERNPRRRDLPAGLRSGVLVRRLVESGVVLRVRVFGLLRRHRVADAAAPESRVDVPAGQ